MKRTNTMLITTVILSIALTSVFAFDIETTQTNTVKDQLPFVAEAISGNMCLWTTTPKIPIIP